MPHSASPVLRVHLLVVSSASAYAVAASAVATSTSTFSVWTYKTLETAIETGGAMMTTQSSNVVQSGMRYPKEPRHFTFPTSVETALFTVVSPNATVVLTTSDNATSAQTTEVAAETRYVGEIEPLNKDIHGLVAGALVAAIAGGGFFLLWAVMYYKWRKHRNDFIDGNGITLPGPSSPSSSTPGSSTRHSTLPRTPRSGNTRRAGRSPNADSFLLSSAALRSPSSPNSPASPLSPRSPVYRPGNIALLGPPRRVAEKLSTDFDPDVSTSVKSEAISPPPKGPLPAIPLKDLNISLATRSETAISCTIKTPKSKKSSTSLASGLKTPEEAPPFPGSRSKSQGERTSDPTGGGNKSTNGVSLATSTTTSRTGNVPAQHVLRNNSPTLSGLLAEVDYAWAAEGEAQRAQEQTEREADREMREAEAAWLKSISSPRAD